MVITPKKELTLFDSTCIIVGIIIGAGIYETAPTVAASMGCGFWTVSIWLIGGFIALTGALNYAELATTYPQQGGDYIYLSRAYGKWAGFIFGWSQLVIIRPGDIAMMAFIFARYATKIYPFENSMIAYPVMAVALLSVINILGVRQGKYTQNLLTVAKALGLSAIIIAALFAPHTTEQQTAAAPTLKGVELALILVLFTFGGWNEMAYVAAEVKRPERNIAKALIIGTVAVTVLYVLANSAFLYALGHKGMTTSEAIAVDTIRNVFPNTASRLVSALICVSALGAVNGLIFTGARISYAMGTRHTVFKLLGKWNPKLGTPTWALIMQALIALAIITFARSFIDTILYTAPAVWVFFLATAISVFVLRIKDKKIRRPWKIPLFPVPTLIFITVSTFMLYSCITFAYANKPKALLIVTSALISGVIVYCITETFFTRKTKDR